MTRAVGVSTVAWDGHGTEVALDGLAAAGGRHVEPAFIAGYVDFDEDDFADPRAAALRRAIDARGLAASALSAHIDLSAPGAAEALRRRIGFAARIGAPILVTNAGPVAGEAAIRRTLDAALSEAEGAGVAVALENPGHGTGDLIADGAAGAAFCDRVGAGPALLGLNLDLGNVHTYAGGRIPLGGQVAAAGRHLIHLHLKDVADRGGDWAFTAVGAGDLPYAALLGEVPADLPISLEMPLRLRRPGRADPKRTAEPPATGEIAEAVRASLAFVARVVRGDAAPPDGPPACLAQHGPTP